MTTVEFLYYLFGAMFFFIAIIGVIANIAIMMAIKQKVEEGSEEIQKKMDEIQENFIPMIAKGVVTGVVSNTGRIFNLIRGK